MGNMLINIIALFVTAPIIATLLLYFISREITTRQRRAIHIAVNWTTIFYLLATFVMLQIIFGQTFIGILIIVFLLLFTIIVVFQWRTKTEINFVRIIKIFWRLCFITFFGFYIVLVCIGIVDRIFFY